MASFKCSWPLDHIRSEQIQILFVFDTDKLISSDWPKFIHPRQGSSSWEQRKASTQREIN